MGEWCMMYHVVRCEWRGGEFQNTEVAVDTSLRLHDLTQKFTAVRDQLQKQTTEVTTERKRMREFKKSL